VRTQVLSFAIFENNKLKYFIETVADSSDDIFRKLGALLLSVVAIKNME